MSGWNRPFGDRFWPVFVGCLVIGMMELAAAGCSLFGELDTAIALEGYWFVGAILSFWLFADLEPRSPDSIWNRTPAESSLALKLFFAGVILAAVVVIKVDSFFPASWYVVVRGTMLGAYLVVLSWAAWGAEAKSPKSAGVPKSELISP